MNLLKGMDIAQIRNLARQMEVEADAIRDEVHQLTSRLEAAPWRGNDREKFLQEWQGRHVKALMKVAAGLDQAARQATEHARQQEAASRA